MNKFKKHISEEHLHAYMDDEISGIERQNIEGHLETCHSCQQRLHDLRALFTEINALRELGYKKDLSQAVMRQIEKTPTPNPYSRWAITLPLLVATLLLLGVWPLWMPYLDLSFPVWNLEFTLNLTWLQETSASLQIWWLGLGENTIFDTLDLSEQISSPFFSILAVSALISWAGSNWLFLRKFRLNNVL